MKSIIFYLTLLILTTPGCKGQTTPDWKEQTEKYFQEKEYNNAVELLEELVSNDPRNAEMHYYLGQSYRLIFFEDGSTINDLKPNYALKASEHFKKVIEISPRYEGRQFVVDPYTKIQGIWGSLAMTYSYRNNIDSALWSFNKGKEEGAFYPAIMEFNKNIMASCKEKAIIFTNGDNDTYPMWFLQLVDNYRRDITVVNLNLLNLTWYIKQLKNNYPFGSNNIGFSLTDEEIENLTPKIWNSQTVKIPVSDVAMDKNIEWILEPTVKGKYLRVQDLMVMDIIKSNIKERPIYFSATASEVNKIGLDEYLSLEGLIYQLKSDKEGVSISNMKENLLNVYSYEGFKDKHYQYIDGIKKLYNIYKAEMKTLEEYYANLKQDEEVYTIKKFMENNIPIKDE